MDFFDWLTKRKKPLSQMSRAELRRQDDYGKVGVEGVGQVHDLDPAR